MTLLTVSKASCNATVCRQGAVQHVRPCVARPSSLQTASRLAAQRDRCIRGLQCRPQTASPAAARRSARLRFRAEADDEAERLPEGTRVRVKQSIKVYHAPKRKVGLDLEGMEGEVLSYVDDYNGKKLSSNLPVKVRFLLNNDGKETKFFSHLVRTPANMPSACQHVSMHEHVMLQQRDESAGSSQS